MRGLTLVALLFVAACHSTSPVNAQCSVDADCAAPKNTCLAGTCIQRVSDCSLCAGGQCGSTCLAGVPGPKGDPGATGPVGPAGPAGQDGTMGATGATGADGAAGPQGAQGPAGPSGPAGATGPAGPAGAPGAAGSAGLQGPQGVAGSPGPAGSLFGEQAAVFAGFTATPVNGVQGGRWAMHAACAQAFPGSHLCHATEYVLANSATPVPAQGAWLDISAIEDNGGEIQRDGVGQDIFGAYAVSSVSWNCQNWTASSYNNGGFTAPTQGLVQYPSGGQGDNCTASHVLACCSSPYKEHFSGYTTATFNGALGGRATMNARCGAEFSGSHLCHSTEYVRAHPSQSPPAGGAWVDISVLENNGGEIQRLGLGSSQLGRYAVQSVSWNCQNWTAVSYNNGGVMAPTQGAVIQPGDFAGVNCTSTLPAACCQ